jgi:hypothetical protein
MPLQIRESYVNATRNVQFGETDFQTAYTDDRGRLFRSLQKEYGRCISRMYRDTKDGAPIVVGWVFSKRMEYEDARRDWSKDCRFYIREVWVEVREVPDDSEV